MYSGLGLIYLQCFIFSFIEKETKSIIKKPLGKPEKVVPEFKRKLGESNKRFLSRVNSMVHEYLNAHKFEQKYKVDIIRDKSGEVIILILFDILFYIYKHYMSILQVLGLEKKPKDEIDELLKKSKKVKKGKKANEEDNIPKLTKSQKRREKLKAKKLKKQQVTFLFTIDFVIYLLSFEN